MEQSSYYANTQAPSQKAPMTGVEALTETVAISDANLFAEAVAESTTPSPRIEAVIKDHQGQEMKQKIPQDSILKRHFLTHVRAQIESRFAPRPSDSILTRHYDSSYC